MDLVQFKGDHFMFYGMPIYKTLTRKSYSDDNLVQQSYVGTMVFDTGETYIGEFDQNFIFQGEGLFMFSIGAIIRGKFEKGKIDGCSFISFPNQLAVLANFSQGVLSQNLYKLDYQTGQY